MRRVYRDNRYRHSAETPLYTSEDPPFYSHGAGLRPLPLILLSAFGIAAAAHGIGMMMGLPFLFDLIVALGLYGYKLYFLLCHQSRYGQPAANRRDKMFGYVILTVILLVLSAFGLYGFGVVGHATMIAPTQALYGNDGFMSFIEATLSKDTYAIVCWIVAAVIEVIIIILVLRDRRDYEY